ncbi:MAG TPA: hypothetical protein VED18_14305 [Candidatus Sulfotelmatobacter sp.]|nr:hypothetical protein [Candidatus Sulfotelmatobacter sp.]
MREIAPRRTSAFHPPFPRLPASLLPVVLLFWLAGWGAPSARAAEYRDPEARFTIALPDGYQEIDRAALEARLEELRRAGVKMPAYAAAFGRGTAPRFAYPYALLEIVPVPGAAWTTADLARLFGQMNAGQAGAEKSATLDRLGLGNLMRDPRITFVRWEPERQAALFRLGAQPRGTGVEGTGRLYFYRGGYTTLWFYDVAGSPYAGTGEPLTAGLTVLPAYRVPPPGLLARARPVLIVGTVAAAAVLLGLIGWLAARRRPAPAAGTCD